MNPTRRLRTSLLAYALLVFFAATLWAQRGAPAGAQPGSAEAGRILQAAINAQTVDGKLEEAIALYQKVVSTYPNERASVATALVRMAQCHEQLGRSTAQGIYERVLRDYADQKDAAAQAKARLVALGGASGRAAGGTMAVRRLWSGTDVDTSGEPSPNGRYVSTRDGSIYPAIRDIETGQVKRFTRKDNWSSVVQILTSTWSPDGKSIAFGVLNKDMSMETWIVGMDDREPRMLLATGVPLDWSSDGVSILALTGKMPAPPLMAVVSVRDGSLNTLSTAENPAWSWSATFTPDGKGVIYDFPQQEKVQARDVFLISVSSKEVTPLVKHTADDRLLGWVPGTDVVLFSSNWAGAQDAWAIHVVNGKPRGEPSLVRQGLGQISPMGFSDRGAFFYSVGVGITEVYQGALEVAKGAMAEPSAKIPQRVIGTSLSPEWSPEGRDIAYVSQRGAGSGSQGPYVLCIRPDKSTEDREIPLGMQSFWQLHWSADGRAIYATAADKENQGVFRLDIQDGKATLLARSDPGSIIKTFAVAPDNKSLFYARFLWEKKALTIVRHDFGTGQEEEIYHKANPAQGLPPDITSLAISPDGKFLSFCTLSPPADQAAATEDIGYAIRVLPAAGGATRDLLPGRIQEWVNPVWAKDGKSLLFGGRMSGAPDTKREIWKVPVDGGDAQKIPSDVVGRDIRFHPDGVRTVFTSGSMMKEIWVMENFLTQK